MRSPPRPLRVFRRVLALLVAAGAAAAAPPAASVLRGWIEEMKASPRGPFERIRWFCADGSVLPPRPYACQDLGGGVQHGEWNERTRQLRAAGYAVANVLAGIDPAAFVGAAADLDRLDQILLERYLMRVDDGWIFRGARSYRGALQAEDEEAGARALVLAMLADPAWLDPARFLRLREAVRSLPLPLADTATATQVRDLALQLAERDPDFTPLRAKIHNVPEAADAEAVRRYARERSPAAMRGEYAKLAERIDVLYAGRDLAPVLREAAEAAGESEAATRLRDAAREIGGADAERRQRLASHALETLRDALPGAPNAEARLVLLEASLLLEDALFATGTKLLGEMEQASRARRLAWLGDGAAALYGVGFLSHRHLQELEASLARIAAKPDQKVDAYRRELRTLGRPPEWAARWLEFHFGDEMERWRAIEPRAAIFVQDRLRSSPLLFYGRVSDALVLDANRLAGIEHELFGQRVGSGLRALNPGLTRGVLVAPPEGAHLEGGLRREGIYLLPESTADLPRVSGILTRGEGSSLSHVQLLARNLGIPNVVVAEEYVPAVMARDGSAAVLAVTPQGVVQLAADGPGWDEIFGAQAPAQEVEIRPDLRKLQLDALMVPLSRLRAKDSGRISGPKGANLGELAHHFGDAVPKGFVISFGVFRLLLEQPIEPDGPSAWEWMKARYDAIAKLDGAERDRAVVAFLTRLRRWIEGADPGPGFREGLRLSLDRLGRDGEFGVFVRSDTNVEDLPGFTGAGLNLTVPNVVGSANVLEAVKRVWASPFTERAYGWRQSHMEDPEYVFPAVVVQRAFPSEKSGVLATVDVDTGERGWLTIAVNEGVGGAVEGQAAEQLKVDTRDGEVRFLAQATAPTRAVLDPRGGIRREPASGTEQVLSPAEIRTLVEFSRDVAKRYPSLQDEEGEPLPADVEFGFRDGELALLQLRPLVENKSARRNLYLNRLDEAFRERGAARVALDAVPRGDSL